MTGKTISHYKIFEKIGQGGMGVVYKAEDLKLKRTVALKFLPPDLCMDQEAKERFIREAQTASALEHSNICNIHDISETEDGQMFIVMAYYEGHTLKEKTRNLPLSLSEAIDISIQIAKGMARAHEKGIIHRDIKPANTLITDDGIVKILDFGLAKLTGEAKITEELSTLGTVAYMSPEQVGGKEIDHRTDIWSFGVLLYEMFTGEMPFKGDYQQVIIYAILNSIPAEPIELKKNLPHSLNLIIMKLLTRNMTERYQSFQDLLADLQNVRDELSRGKATSDSVNNNIFTLVRRPVVFIPTIIIMVMFVFFMFWIFGRNEKIEWAKYIALPEIEQFVDAGNINDAYDLAVEVEKVMPHDSILINLWPQISRPITIYTEPQEALKQ